MCISTILIKLAHDPVIQHGLESYVTSQNMKRVQLGAWYTHIKLFVYALIVIVWRQPTVRSTKLFGCLIG